MKKVFYLYIILVLLSPWIWVMARNMYLFKLPTLSLVSIKEPAFIDEINTLRGESQEVGLGLIGRLEVNKITFYTKSIFERYLESYDPHYLFFVGDFSLLRSTRNSGPLYVSLLPLIIAGLYYSLKERTKISNIFLCLLLLAPLPSSFLSAHYDTLTRIPFFIILTFFASFGFWKIYPKKKIWIGLLAVLLFFEITRFYHFFYVHYTRSIFMELIFKVGR
jgi:hypothetical protein